MTRRRLRTAVALSAVLGVALPVGRAASEEAPGERRIVVVKRQGVTAYEEVAEEFADSCRVRAQVLSLDDTNAAAVRASLRAGDVVVAVGQRALDTVLAPAPPRLAAIQRTPLPLAAPSTGPQPPRAIVAALAFRVPPTVVSASAPPPPEMILRALVTARPSVKRIAVVYGPATEALVERAARAARALGVELLPARAVDGPEAVRALHRLAGGIDALWLTPDPDVLSPQLFQYALALEVKRAVPIAAVTRQQVHSGALLAWDSDPHAIGRQAAELALHLLAGAPPAQLEGGARAIAIELTVNADVARRLGVDLAALRALGARVE